MNEAFIIGEVISKVDYKFIINNKKQFAKAEFIIEFDKQKIKVICYNNIADFCLRYLKENDSVFINGAINTNKTIIIKMLKII